MPAIRRIAPATLRSGFHKSVVFLPRNAVRHRDDEKRILVACMNRLNQAHALDGRSRLGLRSLRFRKESCSFLGMIFLPLIKNRLTVGCLFSLKRRFVALGLLACGRACASLTLKCLPLSLVIVFDVALQLLRRHCVPLVDRIWHDGRSFADFRRYLAA